MEYPCIPTGIVIPNILNIACMTRNSKSLPSEEYWDSSPEIVRRFIEQRDSYQQLCREVEYILGKQISDAKIDVAHITSRAKTLASFFDKLDRKSYKDPFLEITDFAGARIVCLYSSDLEKLEKIVKREFLVLDRIDKLHDMGATEFGYGAIHYIVSIGEGQSGARYDDLKNLSCEIQIRTVLQDAWAIIDHHLAYKKEGDVPSILQRKLNSLAGLFETADDSFNAIRIARDKYIRQLESSTKEKSDFLANELNKDSFSSYLKWKFPDLPEFNSLSQVSAAYSAAVATKAKTIRDLDREYEKARDQLAGLYAELDSVSLVAKNAAIRLKYGLALTHPAILRDPRTSVKFRDAFLNFKEKNPAKKQGRKDPE